MAGASAQSCGTVRVVTVSSDAHYGAKSIDWELQRPTATLAGFREYEVSKLANVLFTRALARRLAGAGVTTYALHPGTVATDLWRKVPWPIRPLMKLGMLTPEQGAVTPVYCATAPELADQTGLYYANSRAKEPSRLARDDSVADELWKRSETWVADYLPPAEG
ncbi:MAG: hypothetical protein ACE5MI_08115 [Acidimicrobiia bacterium]